MMERRGREERGVCELSRCNLHSSGVGAPCPAPRAVPGTIEMRTFQADLETHAFCAPFSISFALPTVRTHCQAAHDLSFPRIEPWIPNVSPNQSPNRPNNDTRSPFFAALIADVDHDITSLENSLSKYARSHSVHIDSVYGLARLRLVRYHPQ